MDVREFEDKVWKVEGIRIVVHAPDGTAVSNYNYKNAANERWRITELCQNRVEKCLDGKTFAVVQGDGESPHGRVILRTIKSGYNRKP